MDLIPIFHAALAATGGDPNAEEFDQTDLENALRALRIVDEKICEAMGDTKVAEITIAGRLSG